MLNSLKSRGLAAGLVTFACILLIALYGQARLQTNLQLNRQSSARISQLSEQINHLNKTVKGVEVSLYQYLLSREPVDKASVHSHIAQLQALIPSLYRHVMVANHSRLQIKVDRMVEMQQRLIERVTALLANPQDRFYSARRTRAVTSWRQGEHLLHEEVSPLLHEINDQVMGLQGLVSQLAARNLARTEYESEQLSRSLWIITFFIMALILLTYLVFERRVRIPLARIARAMLLESSTPVRETLRRVGAREIDQLIEAFETMQAQIRQRQQRITSILQNAGEGIVLIDHLQRIDSFNSQAQHIFGFSKQQVENSSFLKLFDSADHELMGTILSNLQHPQHSHDRYLCQGRHADGRQFPIDLTVSPVQLDDQQYHILVIRDATQRIDNENALNQAREKAETMQALLSEQVEQLFNSLVELQRTQKQLVESEKMASLAGLVTGVAHEINTPIGIGVTASSHLQEELLQLEDKLRQGDLSQAQLEDYFEDTRSALLIIQNNLNRAATLISSFKQVAVDQSSENIRDFNLREYLDEIIMNLQPTLKKTRQGIDIDVADGIVLHSAPGALSQILTNLVINSLQHAFASGVAGRICIRAESDGQNLRLVYQDNGRGMDRETRDKIFEPFFTTQRGSGGSGLGMHITYNLVTATLQGSIKCVSRVGMGARFVLRFPLSIQ